MSARTRRPRGARRGVLAAMLIGAIFSPIGEARGERVSVPTERAPNTRKSLATRRSHRPPRVAREIPSDATIRLDRMDRSAARKRARPLGGGDGAPKQVGLSRRFSGGGVSCGTKGTWARDESGRVTWDIEIKTPGATAVRLHFSRLELPRGSELVIADRDRRIMQRFQGGEPAGRRGAWTTPISGEAVRLAYTADRGVSSRPIIELDEIAHLYDELLSSGNDFVGDALSGDGGLLPCQEDVSCHNVDPNARDAVGRVLYTEAGLGTFLCSGVLLNDADPNTYAGYFLTANHCIRDQATADSVVVYWLYQTDACGGDAPAIEDVPVSSGSALLATSVETDVTLLRLADDPDAGQGFAAWTTDDPVGPVHGIHHPGGGVKRYSLGMLTQEPPICDAYGLGLDRFWYLDWQVGMTEGGSSGSPLFNANGEVVGQLFGACRYAGTTVGCDNPKAFNHLYGKFGVSFPTMANHLLSSTPDDVYEDNDSPADAATLVPGTHALRLVDFDDYFRVNVDQAGSLDVTVTFDPGAVDLGLELLAPDGSTLGTVIDTPGAVTVRAGVSPGSYVLHVEKLHRWGGDYTLAIAIGGPTADFDGDGDVDLADFGHIQGCLTGEGIPQLDAACVNARLDADDDVDGNDLSLFSACLNGADVRVESDCIPPQTK